MIKMASHLSDHSLTTFRMQIAHGVDNRNKSSWRPKVDVLMKIHWHLFKFLRLGKPLAHSSDIGQASRIELTVHRSADFSISHGLKPKDANEMNVAFALPLIIFSSPPSHACSPPYDCGWRIGSGVGGIYSMEVDMDAFDTIWIINWPISIRMKKTSIELAPTAATTLSLLNLQRELLYNLICQVVELLESFPNLNCTSICFIFAGVLHRRPDESSEPVPAAVRGIPRRGGGRPPHPRPRPLQRAQGDCQSGPGARQQRQGGRWIQFQWALVKDRITI